MGHCTRNVVNVFHSLTCFSELGLIQDIWGSGFDHSRDTLLSCHCTLWDFELGWFPADVIKYCLQVGPTLCTYLYSRAILPHVSMAATTVIREDNITDQKAVQLEGVCLLIHASCIRIFSVPLQQSLFISHTLGSVT